jgi:hypothetical protein
VVRDLNVGNPFIGTALVQHTTTIGDEGLAHLQHLVTLQYLFLLHTAISDDGLTFLAALGNPSHNLLHTYLYLHSIWQPPIMTPRSYWISQGERMTSE